MLKPPVNKRYPDRHRKIEASMAQLSYSTPHIYQAFIYIIKTNGQFNFKFPENLEFSPYFIE